MTDIPIALDIACPVGRRSGADVSARAPCPSAAGKAHDSEVERELVERAKRDPNAFAVLYRRHYGPIAGYVYRRLGNTHTTEDLVAEVFLTAMRSLRRYRYRGIPIRAWLYRIATNAVNRWVRQNRKRVLGCLTEHIAAGAESVESAVNGQLDAEAARLALLSVPPKYQAALALHYLEGMGVEAVAKVTGCRIGTVKSRLSRGREALREQLTKGR